MSILHILTTLGYAALVLGGFWLAGSWLAGLVNAALSRLAVEPMLRVWAASAVPAVILGVGLVAALSALGVDTRALLILLGAGALAGALALKDPIGELLAGAMLLSARPYALGDRVAVPGAEGRVKRIALTATTLEGDDGALIRVRSQDLWRGPLRVQLGGAPAQAPPIEPAPAPPPAEDDATAQG